MIGLTGSLLILNMIVIIVVSIKAVIWKCHLRKLKKQKLKQHAQYLTLKKQLKAFDTIEEPKKEEASKIEEEKKEISESESESESSSSEEVSALEKAMANLKSKYPDPNMLEKGSGIQMIIGNICSQAEGKSNHSPIESPLKIKQNFSLTMKPLS